MANCKKCGELVYWLLDENDKPVLVDGGTVDWDKTERNENDKPLLDESQHLIHWKRCRKGVSGGGRPYPNRTATKGSPPSLAQRIERLEAAVFKGSLGQSNAA